MKLIEASTRARGGAGVSSNAMAAGPGAVLERVRGRRAACGCHTARAEADYVVD